MRPQERRRQFLATQGYLIVKDFFTVEEITSVRDAQDAYYRGETNLSPTFQWPAPRPCTVRSRKHPYASFYRTELSQLLRDGRLGTLLKETADLKSIRFWHDQLLYEEPRTPGPVDYHWHREESRWLTCSAEKMLTAWIPLTEFTHEMGPITLMIAGTPRRMTLSPGDLVIFPSTTLHGNPQNFGDRPRRALAAHFASGDLHYRPHGKFRHVNERIVRKAAGLPDFSDPTVCPLLP